MEITSMIYAHGAGFDAAEASLVVGQPFRGAFEIADSIIPDGRDAPAGTNKGMCWNAAVRGAFDALNTAGGVYVDEQGNITRIGD